MKHCFVLLLLCWLRAGACCGQQVKPQVSFSDVDNFWVAYDSIRSTPDSLQQLRYIQRLYIDKGTPGLRAFMEVRNYSGPEWVSLIRRYPRFWSSIRPHTLRARANAQQLEPQLQRLRQLYPALRPASIYFTVGALRSGGTVQGNKVLIGSELATGGPDVDVSEFAPARQAWLRRLYATQPGHNIVPLNVHEYVHTQQKGSGTTLLGQALYEGTCDLVAELVTGRPVPLPYMTYGPAHERELKDKFKVQMYSPYYLNWFYNQESSNPAHVPDLGYYMGYAICKAYYNKAKDKRQAVKDLIELDCTNQAAAEALLRASRYYPEPLDKAALLRAYETNRPTVTAVAGLAPDSTLDASVTEIRVDFSQPMGPTTNTELGPGGKPQSPIIGNKGFSADRKSFTYKVKLEPGRAYHFVLVGNPEGGGFRSTEGYPLKTYAVRFRVR